MSFQATAERVSHHCPLMGLRLRVNPEVKEIDVSQINSFSFSIYFSLPLQQNNQASYNINLTCTKSTALEKHIVQSIHFENIMCENQRLLSQIVVKYQVLFHQNSSCVDFAAAESTRPVLSCVTSEQCASRFLLFHGKDSEDVSSF